MKQTATLLIPVTTHDALLLPDTQVRVLQEGPLGVQIDCDRLSAPIWLSSLDVKMHGIAAPALVAEVTPARPAPKEEALTLDETTPEAINNHIRALLDTAATLVAETGFTPEYKAVTTLEDRKRQGMGIALAKWAQWDGDTILEAAAAAMQDANCDGDAQAIEALRGMPV